MANWRAQVRLPASMDTAIRAYALRNELKLKDAVQRLLDAGVDAIRGDGADHEFLYTALHAAADVGTFEYVLDESYRTKVDGVTAFIPGQGKRGKALTEAVAIGARENGV